MEPRPAGHSLAGMGVSDSSAIAGSVADGRRRGVTARPLAWRPARLLWGPWVAIRGRWLDFLIAGGVDPARSAALTLRARRLTSRAEVVALARAVDRVLSDDHRHRRRGSLAIRAELDCVEAARDQLEAISGVLHDGSLVYARGVALTGSLLRDPQSPLFHRRRADAAAATAERALRALLGHI